MCLSGIQVFTRPELVPPKAIFARGVSSRIRVREETLIRSARDPASGDESGRRLLFETAFRGLLGVGLFFAFPPFSDVYRLWRRDAGLVPGALFGPGDFEYPPLAAPYWELLSGLPSSRAAVAINGLVMVAAAVAITWLLMKVSDREQTPAVRLWATSPVLLFFLPINWDAVAVLMTVGGMVLLHAGKYPKAGAMLGAGVALKVFPGSLFLPLLPMIKGLGRRASFLASGLIMVGGSYLAYAFVRPEGWLVHLRFASSRGEIESTLWGVVDSALRTLGVALSVSQLNLAALSVLGALLVGISLWVARHRPTLGEGAALALIAFLLVNKVFKPQYIIWVLPLLALIGARKATVRTLEYSAILELATYYFVLPSFLVVGAFIGRHTALGLAAIEIVRRRRFRQPG